MKTVAIVPAYNEAELIAKTIQAIQNTAAIDEIAVIDDGSTDQTAQIAESAGAAVLRLGGNVGKGQALNQGWQRFPADVYLFIDADLGESAQFAHHLLTPILAGTADMTIAHFLNSPQTGTGGFGVTKGVASWGIKRMTGRKFLSPLSGQRGIRRQVLEAVGDLAEGFGIEVALTIKAIRLGFRVREVGLPMSHRFTGKSARDIAHRGRQLVMVCSALKGCLPENEE